MISVTSWYLWWIRRRRTHNETVPPTFKCKFSILSIIANASKVVSSPGVASEGKWTRPSPRQVKVNVDASFHADLCAGAIGVVMRDYQGSFIAATSKFIPHVASATMAEALAMKERLRLAITMGCNNIIAESDSLETIEACMGVETWWNASAAIFADCVDMASTIGSVTYRHCIREANKAVHEVARVCFHNKDSCNWVDEPPSFLLNSLLDDVTIVDS